jgi:hypothetical protein
VRYHPDLEERLTADRRWVERGSGGSGLLVDRRDMGREGVVRCTRGVAPEQ